MGPCVSSRSRRVIPSIDLSKTRYGERSKSCTRGVCAQIHSRYENEQTQCGFLNRLPIYLYRNIGTRVHLTRMNIVVDQVHYLCVSVIYPCMDSIVYPQLTPSFHGSMAQMPWSASLRSASYHLFSFVPSSTEHRLLLTYDTLAVTFVRSFVRSCYSWWEHPAVSETSMRDSSSFLDSPPLSSLAPLRFPIPPPHQITSCLLFRRARAFPFSSATYFPGQQVFFRRFSSRIYVCIYDVLAACAYNAMPISRARKNVESDVLLDRAWRRMRGKCSILDFGNFFNLEKYDTKM